MIKAGSKHGRAVLGPARLPLVGAACCKLLLIAILVAVHSRGLRANGFSEHSGVAPLPLRTHRRTLASQPSQDPEIAKRAQAQLLPPQVAGDGGGSVLLQGLIPSGMALGQPGPQPSVAACCAACRANPECTAFWYCDREQGGCTDGAQNLTAPHQGCQLLHQNETAPGTGRPVLLVPAPAFVGGAPLRHAAPAVEGYDAFPGLGFWYRYDFSCEDSVSQPGSCGLDGAPQQNAPRCSGDADCQVMMWFPDGRDYPGAGRPVVLLKGGPGTGPLDLADANINLNAVLYRKRAAAGAAVGSGGGLSTGAIAGIAVGATCAALALAVTAGLCVRRRRQQQHAQRKHDAAAQAAASCDASASSCGMLETEDKASWAGQSAAFTLVSGRSPSPAMSLGLGSSSGAVTASTIGSLPLGPSSAGSVRQLVVGGKACPPAPPPSAANSMALNCKLGHGTVPGEQVPAPTAAPHQPPRASKRGVAAQPAASPRASAVAAEAAAGHSLLSQLPTYGWQRCLVDYAAIEFVLDEEGLPVELGAGASATVYQVLLNGVEPHAAKVFRLGSNPQAQLEFLEEASLLRLLRHRAVVGFAGVCVARGHGIILMELMEGGDLRSRNAEVDEWGLRRFGWYQRGKTVALDIATAIHFLHSSNYTHFDLKSRNVLLSRDLTAKLADVGFTRALRATHHSVEGPIGTLDYMAPELIRHEKKCTSAVDIFSFGALLHELCTGKYPSRGCLRDLHVPLEAPAEVAQLVAACLQEDPALRPTARQLVQTLMALQ